MPQKKRLIEILEMIYTNHKKLNKTISEIMVIINNISRRPETSLGKEMQTIKQNLGASYEKILNSWYSERRKLNLWNTEM